MKIRNALKKVWIKSAHDPKQTDYVRFSLGKAAHSMEDVVRVRVVKHWYGKDGGNQKSLGKRS